MTQIYQFGAVAIVVALALPGGLGSCGEGVGGGAGGGPAVPGPAAEARSGDRDARPWPPPRAYPSTNRVREAVRYAKSRAGPLSFAVADGVAGVRGYERDRRFSSASASKALLLAAELWRRHREGEPLDSGTRRLLEAMITVSDNDAAGAIYARVGDAGLEEVARRGGMRDFEAIPGYWGGAQITAADMARFYLGLRGNLPAPHRRFGMDLLESIDPSGRWGIPSAAGPGWRIWFKGGWRPPAEQETSGPVTHQAGLLRHGGGRRVAIAVLSDQAPGGYAFETIEGIAARLLADPPPRRSRRWPSR